jgi:hypothetical protein
MRELTSVELQAVSGGAIARQVGIRLALTKVPEGGSAERVLEGLLMKK